MNKILSIDEISDIKKTYSSEKLVLVGGCFDILHYGHIHFLKSAKKEGDILIIALESDEFIKFNKKRKPIHTQSQRAEMLSNIIMADIIITLPHFKGYQDYLDLIKNIGPAVIAVTEGDPKYSEKEKQAVAVGAQIKTVCPRLPTPSTTDIIQYASISGR